MPRVWESVAPLAPFSALPNRVSPIGPGVTLGSVPPWFKRERPYAERNFGKREAFSAEACLKASFQADGLGALVPGPGGKVRPNHEVSWELVRIASLALWLARPSALHVELVITAEPEPFPTGSAIMGSSLEPIRPHENYAEASLRPNDLLMADTLATAIPKASSSELGVDCHPFPMAGADPAGCLGKPLRQSMGGHRGTVWSRESDFDHEGAQRARSKVPE